MTELHLKYPYLYLKDLYLNISDRRTVLNLKYPYLYLKYLYLKVERLLLVQAGQVRGERQAGQAHRWADPTLSAHAALVVHLNKDICNQAGVLRFQYRLSHHKSKHLFYCTVLNRQVHGLINI
jgi:hypothetical protein